MAPTRRRGTLTLEMALVAIAEPGAGWRHVRYRVLDRGGQTVEPLGRLDWADWDHGSHLVFARAGCLFRRRVARGRLEPPEQLADFRGLTFEPVAAPEWARRW